jgi:xyloglucan-specific endo-beta-1,4-glucanase
MKGLFTVILAAVVLATASAAVYCGQWDIKTAGKYIVYNNLWNMRNATSGGQCTGVDSASTSDNTISWHSTWSWAGKPHEVKSYANAVLIFTPKSVSQVSPITSTVS